ncbi:hypothetical protein LOD99_14768 [Oopsacas minuta]|uniref:Uncharacterized protein n=1 Tax=Oopsacas minuta TaxID=111878 RepID=A0AAV7KC90_9METZ|nr:hypothetical protein LOD99_14768 [Oopsacas minuta]
MSDKKLDIYTVHAYKKLSRIRPALPIKLLDACHEVGVNTCKDFLLQFPLTLMKQVDIDYQEYITLNRIISRSISPSSSTILSLLQTSESSLRTTLKQVDSILHGGLPPGIITEVSYKVI